MHTTLLLLSGLALAGQTPDEARRLNAAHRQAQEYIMAYAAGDHVRVAAMSPPGYVKQWGGLDRCADGMRQHFAQYAQRKLRIIGMEVSPAEMLHRGGKELIAYLPMRLRTQTTDRRILSRDHLIATSIDDGTTWTFMTRGNQDEFAIRRYFAGWPLTLRLPLPVRDFNEELTPGAFVSAKHNYRITYPTTWRRNFQQDPDDLILWRNQMNFDILPDHANPAPEEHLKEFLDRLRQTAQDAKGTFKELRRDPLRVDGVNAIVVRLQTTGRTSLIDGWVAVFENQGITYRVLGSAPNPKMVPLARECSTILQNFKFLGPRKEWVAQQEGKAARVAFLAGLASIELRRPRWQETVHNLPLGVDPPPAFPGAHSDVPVITHSPASTYVGTGAAGAVESLHFRLHNHTAWVNVWAYDERPSAKTELEDFQQQLMLRLKKPAATRIAVKGPKGFVPAVEITGTHQGSGHTVWASVFAQDGFAVRVCVECVASQRTQVQKDWEHLVATFRFEDPKRSPPLFPIRNIGQDRFYNAPDARPPHPGLTFLKKGTQLFSSQRMHEVQSISADGHQALVRTADGGVLVENLLDRSRIPLQVRFRTDQPNYGGPAAWSRDGKQIAYATPRAVVVMTIGEKDTIDHAGRITALAFLPDNRLLAAHEPVRDALDQPAPRFVQQNLVRFEDEELPQTLLAFPLARFAHLAVSPDGKQLAVTTNRDAPRTAHRPGNLYVGNSDGTGLRQLTKGPENIRSVAWSEDGRWLYVVRRAVPETGYVDFRPGDLYRIDPKSGAADNLTNCGLIDGAWVQGDHFLLRIQGDGVPMTQTGIYKVAQADVTQATREQPAPRAQDASAQAKAIAACIKAAFTPRRLPEIVPTPEVVEKLARTFAEAATDVLGEPFDFSARSLDALPRWVGVLQPRQSGDAALIFGLGAYYGETLRKIGQAEWRLAPVPLGDWLPGRTFTQNVVVEVVLPFSEVYHAESQDGARSVLRSAPMLRGPNRRKLVLAYPPAHAAAALREATPAAYRQAMAHFDRGELKEGLKMLTEVVRAYPSNLGLAQDALELSTLAGTPELAQRMAEDAVAAGSELPEWLARRADALAATDPKQALALYRKAARAGHAPAELYLKLGKLLAADGDRPLAEVCFRRVALIGSTAQRDEAQRLMDLTKPGKETGKN